MFIHNYTKITPEMVKKEKHDMKITGVDRASYVPMDKRIEALIKAGERLETSRRADYHFGKGEPVDYDYSDPSLDTTIDISNFDHIISDHVAFISATGQRREKVEADAAAEREKVRVEKVAQQIKDAKELLASQNETTPSGEDGENGDKP